jgi:hypothetical protein
MPANFDPVATHNGWLKYFLGFAANFDPNTVAPRARPGFASLKENSMAEAYLVGLADEVRPILEATIAWMEAQPEPERRVFAGENEHSGAWPFALYEWRQALGLCKWLSRGDRAEREFAGALDAEWQAWEQVSSKQAAAWRADRRSMLGQYLAMALAANAPTLGLKFYEASGVKRPSGRSGPARGFGQ